MSEIFKFKTPAESNGFLLWKVNNLWQREIQKTLKKYDLTHTQFIILASAFWLSQKSDEVKQVEIADLIEIDKMMTSNVIRKLIEKNLIDRKEHQTDTRAKVIQLTPNGIETLKKSITEVENFDIAFFGPLSNNSVFNKELLKLLNDKTAEKTV